MVAKKKHSGSFATFHSRPRRDIVTKPTFLATFVHRDSDDEPWQPKESPDQPLIDSFLAWMSPVPFNMPQEPAVHHPQLCKCAECKAKERRIGKETDLPLPPPPPHPKTWGSECSSSDSGRLDINELDEPPGWRKIRTLLTITGSLDIDTANRNQSSAVSPTIIDVPSTILPSLVLRPVKIGQPSSHLRHTRTLTGRPPRQ